MLKYSAKVQDEETKEHVNMHARSVFVYDAFFGITQS